MPNDFVNTITLQNGTTYDVQDKRITATSADAGKVVSFDNNGNLILVTPSGGTKLYQHILDCTDTHEVLEYRFYCYSTSNLSFAENVGSFQTIGGVYRNDSEGVSIIGCVPSISIFDGPKKHFIINNREVMLILNDTISEL